MLLISFNYSSFWRSLFGSIVKFVSSISNWTENIIRTGSVSVESLVECLYFAAPVTPSPTGSWRQERLMLGNRDRDLFLSTLIDAPKLKGSLKTAIAECRQKYE